MPTFLHVPDSAGQPDAEHPTQGRLPDGKLVWQPPTQLPEALSSLRSFANTDSCAADGVGVVGDVAADTVLRTVLRATARCFGFCGLLATCFGASIRMLGREVVAPPEGVAVCDIAVPLRPHSSSAIDKIATARPARKSDDAFMAISFQILRTANAVPDRTILFSDFIRVNTNLRGAGLRSELTCLQRERPHSGRGRRCTSCC